MYKERLTFARGFLPELSDLYAIDCPQLVDLQALLLFTFHILPVLDAIMTLQAVAAVRASYPYLHLIIRQVFRLKCKGDGATGSTIAHFLTIHTRALKTFSGFNSTEADPMMIPSAIIFNTTLLLKAMYSTYSDLSDMLHGF
jgi:hypothetical protein